MTGLCFKETDADLVPIKVCRWQTAVRGGHSGVLREHVHGYAGGYHLYIRRYKEITGTLQKASAVVKK